MYIIWSWAGAQVHLPGSERKQTNSFTRLWFTLVSTYFIWQPKMTPQARLGVHAVWNGDVSLAPACCEVLPRLCSELFGTGALLRMLRWGRMREEKNEKGRKITWKAKGISNIYKYISFPNFLASFQLVIGKVSIHFPSLWFRHALKWLLYGLRWSCLSCFCSSLLCILWMSLHPLCFFPLFLCLLRL